MKEIANSAHVLYWDSQYDVIKSCTIYAETVYPLTLIQAILAFRPEFAKEANVTFNYVTGGHSVTNVIKF